MLISLNTYLVHIATEEFILFLQPLDKSLGSNDTCFLLLGTYLLQRINNTCLKLKSVEVRNKKESASTWYLKQEVGQNVTKFRCLQQGIHYKCLEASSQAHVIPDTPKHTTKGYLHKQAITPANCLGSIWLLLSEEITLEDKVNHHNRWLRNQWLWFDHIFVHLTNYDVLWIPTINFSFLNQWL